MTKRLTRRHLLGLAGASAAGAAGLHLGTSSALAASDHAASNRGIGGNVPFGMTGYVTEPGFRFPQITLHQYGPVSKERYFFLDVPYTASGHGGTAIVNSGGQLVWFGPNTLQRHRLDFNTQMLTGSPVLTWWQGQVVDGHGEGDCVIADSTYTVQHTVKAGNKLRADLHEFQLTPQGTALITAYRTHSGVDLSGIHGGAANSSIYSGVLQEIDITTGDVIFEWDSYPTVPVTESYLPIEAGRGTAAMPYDYFHINSIDQDTDGNFIVSSRHTWTIYKISSTDGSIIWRMNGKNSDFTMGKKAIFHWQHHVRLLANGQLTVFDNGACAQVPANEPESRALILNVGTKTVTLAQAYTHPGARVLAKALGSAQVLPDGGMFVDWGAERRFSQFDEQGNLLLDAQMVVGASSYRGFSQAWTGHPTQPPAVAALPGSGGATVYASWNGATGVASWAVFAGPTSTSVKRIASGNRTGFETAIPVRSKGPYFAVHALSAAGKVLGQSAVVRIS